MNYEKYKYNYYQSKYEYDIIYKINTESFNEWQVKPEDKPRTTLNLRAD